MIRIESTEKRKIGVIDFSCNDVQQSVESYSMAVKQSVDSLPSDCNINYRRSYNLILNTFNIFKDQKNPSRSRTRADDGSRSGFPRPNLIFFASLVPKSRQTVQYRQAVQGPVAVVFAFAFAITTITTMMATKEESSSCNYVSSPQTTTSSSVSTTTKRTTTTTMTMNVRTFHRLRRGFACPFFLAVIFLLLNSNSWNGVWSFPLPPPTTTGGARAGRSGTTIDQHQQTRLQGTAFRVLNRKPSAASSSSRSGGHLVRRLQRFERPNQTALFMGIRSLLGLGTKKAKSDATTTDTASAAPESATAAAAPEHTKEKTGPSNSTTVSTRAIAQIPVGLGAASSSSGVVDPPPLRMGEDPTTKEVDVYAIDQKESVQERINRVKSGKMTENEKHAFLQSALSAGNTPESRKPFKADTSDDRKKMFASPFPKDSILRAFARGGKNDADIVTASQKVKQDYVDMVTDPDRFHRYKATSSSSTDSTKGGEQPPVSNMGARLGAAAFADENRRQQQLKEQEDLEGRRLEYERKSEEMLRKRQDEIQQLETQNEQSRRQKELALQQEKERKKKEEEERLQELMKAQDEYWKQKLAKEREAKEAQLKEQKAESDAEREEKGGAPVVGVTPSTAPAKTTTAQTAFSGPNFNPDERSLLDAVRSVQLGRNLKLERACAHGLATRAENIHVKLSHFHFLLFV